MIERLLGMLNVRRRAVWLWRSIDRALALNRTEVRPDGLRREQISLRLLINWRARDLHPWDLDLVGNRMAVRLVEQTFSDTVAALERLFNALPEVDAIDFRVLEMDVRRDGTLLGGSVSRRDFETWHPSSAIMRLKLLGVNYNLVNSHFEPMDTYSCKRNGSSTEISAPPASAPYKGVAPPNATENEPKQAWHQDRAGRID
jgi:hypothetical protein